MTEIEETVTNATVLFEPGSFKDPEGRVFYFNGKVYRSLSDGAVKKMEMLKQKGHLDTLIKSGLIIPTKLISSRDAGIKSKNIGPSILEHSRINIISYSYEWPFTLLRDAAIVTLDIIEQCLSFDHILKDATPYNISLYNGRPVLIDILSIDRYQNGTPWEGYAQFCREFLFPLLLATHKKIDVHDFLRGSLNGISTETIDSLFSFSDLLKPGVLKHIKLQAMLQRSFKKTDFNAKEIFKENKFGKELILTNLKNLRKIINSLDPSATDSTWIDYTDTHSYDANEEAEKINSVRSMLKIQEPNHVIDIGCNTGAYSRIVAETAETVVSLDFDASCIDRLYRNCRNDNIKNIYPIVSNMLNPSPGMGWMMCERAPLFERIRGDSFLALALVHHVCISGNVPLENFIEALRNIAKSGVVEWVDKTDPMVQTLLKNRKDVFDTYTWDNFKYALEQSFEIKNTTIIGGGRRRLCHVSQKEYS